MSANRGEIIASAWNNKIGKVNDNFFNATPLFSTFKEGGFQKDAKGGAEFEFTLELSDNPNVSWIGETGSIPTDSAENFDVAIYTPKIQASTVQITFTEELRTAGESGKFDFVAAKLENQKKSLITNLNQALFGDGSAPDTIDGLRKLISVTPSTGAVGGVNPALVPQWRNQQANGAHTSAAFDNIRSVMRSQYNLIEQGDPRNAPKYFITTSAVSQGLEGLIVANDRIIQKGSKSQGANLGLDAYDLFFKNAQVKYDVDCPAGFGWFLNPEYLKLVYYEGGFMHMHPVVEPGNQLVKSHRVSTHAQLCVTNRRRLGVINAID